MIRLAAALTLAAFAAQGDPVRLVKAASGLASRRIASAAPIRIAPMRPALRSC
ncbi:MAG: hypothetical protein ABI886_01435 [Betaproteobacteria bacterium]